MTVEGLKIPLVTHFPTVDDPLGQVWVRNGQSSKADGIAETSPDLGKPSFSIEGVVGDQNARVEGSQSLANIGDLFLPSERVFDGEGVNLSRLLELNKADLPCIEFLQQQRVGFNRILVVHILDS